MCFPGAITAVSSAAGLGKKDDREAQTRQRDIVNQQQITARKKKKITDTKKKKNLDNFNTNIATGGQKRAANIGV